MWEPADMGNSHRQAAEAARDYAGAVPPEDPSAIQKALPAIRPLLGQRFEDPHSWQSTVEAYEKLVVSVHAESDQHLAGELAGSRLSTQHPAPSAPSHS